MTFLLADENEYRLIRDLFINYDKRVRPSIHHSQPANITYGVALAQIIDVVIAHWQLYTCTDPEGGAGGQTFPGKSQVAKGFLRNSGTDQPREAVGPFGSNCLSREVRMVLCEMRWWIKKGPHPLTKFSGSAHGISYMLWQLMSITEQLMCITY